MSTVASSVTLCAQVAMPLPMEGTFSYTIPAEWEAKAKSGVRVLVPFKNREMVGYLVEIGETPSGISLKPILSVLDETSILSASILALTKWIAEYYGCSWGEAIENALPKWIKYGKKAERALQRDKSEIPTANEPPQDLDLSGDQQKAFERIKNQLASSNPKPVLLYGVTGSGKSEIYIRAIREVLQRNQSAICLVPEIALTEQLRRFFLCHFGSRLEILHSKLSDNERFCAWKRLESGERRVVLGPRSAVFAPLLNLGLIIMDEEHEGTYKQETVPRYHAREVALCRSRHEHALFLMGTATPSLEAMHRAEQGEFERIDLATRIDEKAMPQVQILDLKNAVGVQKKKSLLSSKLIHEIELNLRKKEGTLLLLNRRGFYTHIQCTRCGFAETCKSCQVSLTLHQEDDILLCHYCNYQKPIPASCPQCQLQMLRFAGFGTEKVESDVAALFPQARIGRMDADSVRKKNSHEEILKEFREQKLDILIGTQMIAKGFDFPHVTLAGIILADVGLMLPDFRAGERTFQLLTQMAGRAGRGKLPGRVIIQTYSPDHPSIRFAKDHDYMSFYRHELQERAEYHYPPHSRLINIIIRSRTEKKAYLFARELRDALQESLRSNVGAGFKPAPTDEKSPHFFFELIGPTPLPFYKLRGHFRWHVMIKAGRERELTQTVRSILFKLKKPSDVAFALDVDPVNIL